MALVQRAFHALVGCIPYAIRHVRVRNPANCYRVRLSGGFMTQQYEQRKTQRQRRSVRSLARGVFSGRGEAPHGMHAPLTRRELTSLPEVWPTRHISTSYETRKLTGPRGAAFSRQTETASGAYARSQWTILLIHAFFTGIVQRTCPCHTVSSWYNSPTMNTRQLYHSDKRGIGCVPS